MKNNVLFVTEKWIDSRPELGLTPSFHNYFYPYAQYGKYNLSMIHLDESAIVYQTHINDILVKFCEENNVKVIVFSLLGDSVFNPSLEVYLKLKKMGIFLCFLWHDIGPGWGERVILQLKDIGNFHISVDNSSYAHERIKLDNLVYLPAPQNKAIFYPQEQDIMVSFMGSQRVQNRRTYLEVLSQAVPNIVIGGGQRETGLPIEKYAEIIRRSKIGINFSRHSLGFSQTKGRVSEIISSGSLLLEEKNACTPKFFAPNKDYVEFIGLLDLVEKIKYYNDHEEERVKIAKSGYETYCKHYSTNHFWDLIFNKVVENISTIVL